MTAAQGHISMLNPPYGVSACQPLQFLSQSCTNPPRPSSGRLACLQATLQTPELSLLWQQATCMLSVLSSSIEAMHQALWGDWHAVSTPVSTFLWAAAEHCMHACSSLTHGMLPHAVLAHQFSFLQSLMLPQLLSRCLHIDSSCIQPCPSHCSSFVVSRGASICRAPAASVV